MEGAFRGEGLLVAVERPVAEVVVVEGEAVRVALALAEAGITGLARAVGALVAEGAGVGVIARGVVRCEEALPGERVAVVVGTGVAVVA